MASYLQDKELQEPFKHIHIKICSIVRLLNSQREEINVEGYHSLCKSTLVTIVTHFPWAKVSPSLHKVLCHTGELIELNDGKGLGSQSEEGLEALNKYIRHLRVHGARKTSVLDNLQDVYIHLWRRSSPLIVAMEREKAPKKRKQSDPSEIDKMVESLLSKSSFP